MGGGPEGRHSRILRHLKTACTQKIEKYTHTGPGKMRAQTIPKKTLRFPLGLITKLRTKVQLMSKKVP